MDRRAVGRGPDPSIPPRRVQAGASSIPALDVLRLSPVRVSAGGALTPVGIFGPDGRSLATIDATVV